MVLKSYGPGLAQKSHLGMWSTTTTLFGTGLGIRVFHNFEPHVEQLLCMVRVCGGVGCRVVPDMVPSEPPAQCCDSLVVVLDLPWEVQFAIRIGVLLVDQRRVPSAAQTLTSLDLACTRSCLFGSTDLAVCSVVLELIRVEALSLA